MEFVTEGRRQKAYQQGTIKPCCQNPRNLITLWERQDLEVKTCQACGCRHRRFLVDPIRIGLK